MEKLLFLVVEDHPEVAQHNCDFLQQVSSESRCLIANSPDAAIERLKLEVPDLAVVDLQFGSIRGEQSAKPGIDLLKLMFDQYKNLNILVYTSEPTLLRPLINQINKHEGGFAVVNKLERRVAFTSGAQSALVGELRLPRDLRNELKLTTPELQALELICQNSLTDKALAETMHVSLRTAQNYVQRLKVKLNVDGIEESGTSSRVALCMEAVKRKLLLF